MGKGKNAGNKGRLKGKLIESKGLKKKKTKVQSGKTRRGGAVQGLI